MAEVFEPEIIDLTVSSDENLDGYGTSTSNGTRHDDESTDESKDESTDQSADLAEQSDQDSQCSSSRWVWILQLNF